MAVKIDEKKCDKNHECPAAASCPVQALIQKKVGCAPEVDPQKCIECGLCTTICPNGALSL